MPDRDTTRINERIRVPEVRLIDENGEQVGILPTDQALRMAQDRDLDLVEVAAASKPPVCRILDYSKYKYEQAQKQKAARKHQTQIVLREIKFRPKIAQHDYDTKKGHVERFLLHKDKVKITIMFRGREVTHPERGQMILERLAEELELIAQVDQRPQQDGRNMTMLLSPSKAVLAGQIDAEAWKNRDNVDPLADSEGITVDGPGEEPTPTPPPAAEAEVEAKPARAARPAKEKAEAVLQDEPVKGGAARMPKAEPEAEEPPTRVEEAPTPQESPVKEAAAPEIVAEPTPEPEPEPEPEVEPEPPKPAPKPKKAGPPPVSKAEAARKRTPKPKLNLGTGAASPLAKKDEEDDAEGTPAKKPGKAPSKAAAAAAVARAKKPAAKKAAAKKTAASDAAGDES